MGSACPDHASAAHAWKARLHCSGACASRPTPCAARCRHELVPHEQPRIEVFVDKEVQQSSVYVSFKHALPSLCTPVRPNRDPTLGACMPPRPCWRAAVPAADAAREHAWRRRARLTARCAAAPVPARCCAGCCNPPMSVPAATAERAGRRPRARRRQADYRAHLCASMWHSALNQRLFRISRRSDPPFYSAEARARS